MPSPVREAVHLVTADTSTAQLETLRALLTETRITSRQTVLLLGAGSSQCGIPITRVHVPLSSKALRTHALSRVLRKHRLFDGQDPTIVHAWSLAAATWIPRVHRVATLVQIDPDADLRPSSTSHMRPEVLAGRRIVCPTAAARQDLLRHGIPADRCTVIHPSVDDAALDAAQRGSVRQRLGLADDHIAIAALPPVSRSSGAFTAAWAALLLEKVLPNVRLLIPAGGCGDRRVRELIEACRHEWMVRLAPPEMDLSGWLAAADIAACLPAGHTSLASVAWAMASGCPLVTTDVPALTGVLRDGHNAWLCQPNDPQDAARRMLEAIENRQQSDRQVAAARAEARELFSRPRMIAQYQQTYADIIADRSPQSAQLPAEAIA